MLLGILFNQHIIIKKIVSVHNETIIFTKINNTNMITKFKQIIGEPKSSSPHLNKSRPVVYLSRFEKF